MNRYRSNIVSILLTYSISLLDIGDWVTLTVKRNLLPSFGDTKLYKTNKTFYSGNIREMYRETYVVVP